MVHPVGGSCSIWSRVVPAKKNIMMLCCNSGVNVMCGYLYLENYSGVRDVCSRVWS